MDNHYQPQFIIIDNNNGWIGYAYSGERISEEHQQQFTDWLREQPGLRHKIYREFKYIGTTGTASLSIEFDKWKMVAGLDAY